MVTHFVSCCLFPAAPLLAASSSKCFAHPFLMVNRSRILLVKPPDPKAARNVPREVLWLIISFQTALLTFDSPCSISLLSQQSLQRLIVGRHACLIRPNGCNLLKLQALFVALLVAHVLDPQRFAPPHLGRNPSSSKLLLSSALARDVVLRLRRFFPWNCFPLFLRSPSAPRKVSVLQRAHPVEVNPGHVRETDLHLGALGSGCRHPSDTTPGSIHLPRRFGFRPYPFQCH